MSYTNGVGGFQPLLGSITSTPSATTQPASPSHHRSASVGHPGKETRADQTNLSSASGLIAHALEGSDTRAEKVAALQQAIASGNYRVSSADVAGKMIQSLLE